MIVPDTIVIDHGKVFVSETFTRACDRLGISVQPARPGTPTDKGDRRGDVRRRSTPCSASTSPATPAGTSTRRGAGRRAPPGRSRELQDLLDEWLIVRLAGPPARQRCATRSSRGRAVSPNDAYAALVAAAGYLPLTLSGEDYLELLPVDWRQINAYGIRIDYRTYDCPELGPWRRQHSGVAAKRGLLGGPLRPLRPVAGVRPHPRRRGSPRRGPTCRWSPRRSPTSPGATPAGWPRRPGATTPTRPRSPGSSTSCSPAPRHGPVDRASARVAARTRVAAATHRPPQVDKLDDPAASATGDADGGGQALARR